jgi:hypothetical protein
VHGPTKGSNSRWVTEIIRKPLRKLMVFQPANKPGVAVGTQDPADMRVSAVLVIDVGRLAWQKSLVADRTLAALVGVDPVVVFRG